MQCCFFIFSINFCSQFLALPKICSQFLFFQFLIKIFFKIIVLNISRLFISKFCDQIKILSANFFKKNIFPNLNKFCSHFLFISFLSTSFLKFCSPFLLPNYCFSFLYIYFFPFFIQKHFYLSFFIFGCKIFS